MDAVIDELVIMTWKSAAILLKTNACLKTVM